MKPFVMIALATTLMSSVASAETTIAQKTIEITCSPNVQKGTVVLAKPIRINCDDFRLAKSVMGTGITVGPDSKVDFIISKVKEAQSNTIVREEVPVYDAASFDGLARNKEWFELDEKTVHVKDDPSGRCKGWVNLNDILNGKCGQVKVQLN